MMIIEAVGPLNSGIGAGGAGVATNNATGGESITGQLLGFYIRYNDSPPAGTTDVTIETTGGVMPGRTLLTISNAATDGFFPVRLGAVSTANAAITDSNVLVPLVRDKIKVTIAQANNGDSVDIWTVVC
jgi:hypothetical protein